MTTLMSSVLSTAVPTFKPALPPPPGVLSNPKNPETLKQVSTIAVTFCFVLTTIFFAARCYCRYWIKSTFIFEDIMASLACEVLSSTALLYIQRCDAMEWFNVVSVEYGIVIRITKVTVLTLYRRVFVTHLWTKLDVSIITLIISLSLFYGITTFFKIFECEPGQKIWKSRLPGHCYDIGKILKTSGAFNSVSDFLILLLPINAVYHLQMSKQKKILVVLVFTFGLCAPVFATVGFVVRLQRSSNKDASWGQPTILLWGLAELTSGNLCISFPEMGPLICPSTRNKSHGAPCGPTASEPVPYKEASSLLHKCKRKLRPRDPYMMTSLLETTRTTSFNDDGTYIELGKGKDKPRIAAVEKIEKGIVPKEDVIRTDSEVSVSMYEAL